MNSVLPAYESISLRAFQREISPAKSSWASLAQETQDLAILGKMFIRSWQDLTYIKKHMPHLDYNAKMSRSNIGSWQDCCKMLQI